MNSNGTLWDMPRHAVYARFRPEDQNPGQWSESDFLLHMLCEGEPHLTHPCWTLGST